MIGLQNQNLYELLEISTTASVDEIRIAYEKAIQIYGSDSVAVYALEDPSMGEFIRTRLGEARRVLTNSQLREEYDRGLRGSPVAGRNDFIKPPPTQEEKSAAEKPKGFNIPADAEISGDLLKRARNAKGFTTRQMADRTRITLQHLENIESDKYTSLPATVYLRGMLMNIARELGLDEIRVAKGYLVLVGRSRTGS